MAPELKTWPAGIALAVLVANDHWLKGSGLVPGWLTGKASDVAGLFLAPLVLLALARCLAPRWCVERPRLPFVLATVVAVAFTALKTSPPICSLYSHVFGHAVCDPTDLVALPFAFAAALWCGHVARRTPRPRVFTERILVGIASLACLATSRPPPSVPPLPPGSVLERQPEVACARARIVGDHVEGRTGTVIIELKTEPGRENCLLRLSVVEKVQATRERWFTVHATASALLAIGETKIVTVPLVYPTGEQVTCDTRRDVDIGFNEGEESRPVPAYRDDKGELHGDVKEMAVRCVPSQPLAR